MENSDEVTSEVNDTIAAALKLAGLTTEDCVEHAQAFTVETVADTSILAEVATLKETGLTAEDFVEHAQVRVEAGAESALQVTKEAHLTTEDYTEQTRVIAVEDSILEVTTSEDNLQGTVIVILPPEERVGEQQNGIEEQEVHTSNDDDGHFTCSNCSDCFTERKKFHEHKCSKIVLDEFLCKDCGKVCTDDDSLKIHAAGHLKQKEKQKLKKHFECKKCKKVFSQKWSCENHSCHSKRFMCEYCGMGYGRKGDMKRHIVSVHTETKPYQCKSCDKKFATKWHLAQHEQVHTRGKAFQCQICGKRYSQKSHLERHKCVHSVDSAKCTDCSRWFVNNSEFSLHKCKAKKDHQPLRFSCHLCEKTFSRKNDLKRHQFLHTGNKPFPCNYCEKSFVTSWQLKHHDRSHTGEKPYHCHCGKQFTQKSHFDNHQISHASQVYRCKHCKRRFTEKESLARHESVHLNNKDQNVNVNIDSGLDTALECLLGFANESDKATDIIADSVSYPNTTETVIFGDNEKVPSMSDDCIDVSMTTESASSGIIDKVPSKSDDRIGDIVSQPNTTKTFNSDDGEKLKSSDDDNDIDSKVDEVTNNLITQSGFTDENEPANDVKNNVCKYCKRVFKFRARLLKHYVTHTAFHFDTDTNLLSRQESEYLDNGSRMKLFTCLGCNRTYSNEDKCNDHRLKCESHIIPPDQIESNGKTSEDSDLDNRLPVDDDLVCKVCKKVFLSKQKHHQHMIYHRRRSFSNVFVKSREPSVKMLDIKLLFVCSYCSKEFAYKTSFERHEYQHQQFLGSTDTVKPTHLHICPQCGKDFRRITHLKRHILLHKENKTSEKQNLAVIQETMQDESKEPSVQSMAEPDATKIKTMPLQDELLSPSRASSRPKRIGNFSKGYRSESDDLEVDTSTVANSTSMPSGLSEKKRPNTDLWSSVIQKTKKNDLIQLPSNNSDANTSKIVLSEAEEGELIKSPSRTGSRPVRIRNIPKRYQSESKFLQMDAPEDTVQVVNPSKKHITKGYVVGMNVEENKKIRKSKRTAARVSIANNSIENSNDINDSNSSQVLLAELPHKVTSNAQAKIKSKRLQMHKEKKNIKEDSKQIKTKIQITFECKRCKKEFTSKPLLNRHLKHDSNRPLMCRICCRRFNVKESLQRHEAGHDGNYMLSCIKCGKGFNHQHTLETHMQKHTGNKTHMCDVCGKMFITKYNLKVHGYIHSGNSPNKCKFCGKHFGRKNDLHRHELNHQGSQPFSCSLCERKFVHRWHLRYHEKSHVNKET